MRKRKMKYRILKKLVIIRGGREKVLNQIILFFVYVKTVRETLYSRVDY